MALSAILEGLLTAQIRFILVGGLAAVVQGAHVATMDVDIVHDRSPENVSRLMVFLQSIDAVQRRLDDRRVAPSESDLSGPGHCLLNTRLGPLDVLGVIERGMGYADLHDHSIDIEFRGHVMQVLALEMLVELKRASKDQRDRRRLSVLEETLRQSTPSKRDR